MCGIARGFVFFFWFSYSEPSPLKWLHHYSYFSDFVMHLTGILVSTLAFYVLEVSPIFEAQKLRAEKVFRHTLICKPLFWGVNLYENLQDANEWLNQNFGNQEYFMLYVTFKTGGNTAVFLKEVLNRDSLLKINLLFKHLHFLRVEPDTQDYLSTRDGISSTGFLYC